MDFCKKQTRYNFRKLLKDNGGTLSRESYCARAFLTNAPYWLLERHSHDQLCFSNVAKEAYRILFYEEFKEKTVASYSYWAVMEHFKKKAGLDGKDIEKWCRVDVDGGKVICGGGWLLDWRTTDKSGGTRHLLLHAPTPTNNERLDVGIQYDSGGVGEESAASDETVG